jgi:menaquinone-specific isochorismate synthase
VDHADSRREDEECLLDRLPLADTALAWVRNGDGLVGWGEAARFETSGPGRFAEAERWWREYTARLDVRDELGVPGSGPVAFLSMAFADDPGSSVLVVPEVVVGRRGAAGWITRIGEVAETDPAPQPVRAPGRITFEPGQLSVAGYRDAVRTAVARMQAGELDKIVLAHDLLARAEEPVDQRFLLRELARRYPNCWAYAVDGLVGATPELLLRRTGQVVDSQVLAGTTWPRDGVTDEELVAALVGSHKDQEEHGYAVSSLADTLRPFCASLSVAERPSVLRLPNVSHLASRVSGTLRGEASLLAMAAAVHPTAAVGGTPRDLAVPLIRELEGMDRGRYAGPIGWIDANGDGELGIALRCAQVSGSTARLFAGCGIVAESDPDTEVREAAAKMVPMRDALQGA